MVALLAALGAVSALRLAASAVVHATLAAARLMTGHPWVGERTASRQQRNPTIYCTKYGDKYHVDPTCYRIQAAQNEPFSREYCELCGWQYTVVASRKPKVL